MKVKTTLALAVFFIIASLLQNARSQAISSPTTTTTAPTTTATSVPTIYSRQLVYTFEEESRLVRSGDGRLWLYNDTIPLHDECRTRHLTRTLPDGINAIPLLDKSDIPQKLDDEFQGIDAKDRAWFTKPMKDENKTIVTCTDGNNYIREELNGTYSGSYRQNLSDIDTAWPFTGHEMITDNNGIPYIIGEDRMYLGIGEERREIQFPQINDKDDSHDFQERDPSNNLRYFDHRIFLIGKNIWMIRSIESDCRSRGSFVIKLFNWDSEISARTKDDDYIRAIVHKDGDAFALVEHYGQKNSGYEYSPVRILKLIGDEPEISRISDIEAARLLFIDNKGRQYIQAWSDSQPTDRMLIIDDEKTVELKLPSPKFAIDSMASNGKICCRDSSMLYLLDTKDNSIVPVASLGELATPNIRFIDFKNGQACIEIAQRKNDPFITTPILLDINQESRIPILQGQKIASDVYYQTNPYEINYSIVTDANQLWFVKHDRKRYDNHEHPPTQLEQLPKFSNEWRRWFYFVPYGR